jgi:hypothetical protein
MSADSSPTARRLVALACLSLLCSTNARATGEDVQAWAVARVNHRLNESWAASFMARGRWDENVSHNQDYLLRPYITWTGEGVPLTDDLGVSLGYDRLKSYTGRDEHRAWQSAFHKVDRGGFRFVHRLRMDERFVDGVGPTIWRARYRLSTTQQLFGSKWYALARNEVFVNLNDGNQGPSDGFEQNRFRVGAGRWLFDRLRAELAYEFQYVERRAQSDTFRHVFSIELSLASGRSPGGVVSGTEAVLDAIDKDGEEQEKSP